MTDLLNEIDHIQALSYGHFAMKSAVIIKVQQDHGEKFQNYMILQGLLHKIIMVQTYRHFI